jgi:hypothetical protein
VAAKEQRVAPSNDGRTGIEADPQLRPQSMLDLEIVVGGLKPPQDGKRRTTGAQRRVFERDRRAEDRHDGRRR